MRNAPKQSVRAVAVGLAALVAGTLAGAGPAAADDPDPGPAGEPVSTELAAGLHALSCVPGGATSGDVAIAAALRPDMNGVRLGSSISGYNVSCARAIVAEVRAENLDQRAAQIALTTAITESTLHNWDGGDDDSIGLFQQRPSQGWGSVAQLEDPAYATRAFLKAMQRKYPNGAWESGDIGAICQRVQVSAFPDAYDHEVHDAGLLAGKLWSSAPPDVPPRIGVLTTGGAALVKQGGLSTSWVTEYGGVQQLVVAGDRIGVLTTGGVVLVKDGGLSAAWTTEYTGAQQIALSGDRIGVLTTGGTALVKEGGLSAGWVTEYTGVQQLALAGDRIGVRTTAGAALVKDGGLSALWVDEYSGVQQLALAGNRIGVVTTAGTALVKDGGLSAGWTTEYPGVQQIVLAGDRIGVVTTAGTALVKDGSLSADWATEHAGVPELALAGNRIGVRLSDGTALVKDGGLSAGWVTEHDDIQQLSLS